MPTSNNPWKTVSSRIVHQSRWLTLYEDNAIKPNGEPGTYTFTTSPPFVLIVGYDGERFIMVRQYRYPLKRTMIEFPGGSIDNGEEPIAAAKREFTEETGLAAKKWTNLGAIHNPNLATIFLAEELTDTASNTMGEDGITDTIRPTWAEIDNMIKEGSFTDSKTMAALLLFERHQRRTANITSPC
jgi:8-oxo-dGTP pyrophosphatase MutT (NUDIX family)